MSQKQLYIIAAAVIFVLLCMYGIYAFSSKGADTKNIPKNLTIWMTEGTTDGYADIIKGFKTTYPEYKNTNIVFNKYGSYTQYKKLLQSSLADGTGPDIFTVYAGADIVLEKQIEAIPSPIIDTDSFITRYDSIFADMVVDNPEYKKDPLLPKAYIKGVPMGYETLALVYNKSQMPVVPTTWDEYENMLATTPTAGTIGLGMGPRYTAEMLDILTLLHVQGGNLSLQDIAKNDRVGTQYFRYGDIYTSVRTDENGIVVENILQKMEKEKKLTLVDMLVRGEVSAILAYPSTIREMEYAKKRSEGNMTNGIFLVAPVPQISNDIRKQKNLAKYWYFGVSRSSTNGYHAAKFLSYLTTDDAYRLYLQAFPYTLPAISTYTESQYDVALSTDFARIKLRGWVGTDIQKIVFPYLLRDELVQSIGIYLDRNPAPDIKDMYSTIFTQIQCEISLYDTKNVDGGAPCSR